MARARRVGRVARALVAACGEAAPAADPIRSPQAPTWTSRPSFRSAPLARVRAFHSIPFSAASRAAAPTLALVPGAPRLPFCLGDHPARALPTRSYFAGHPQIRNAEGQDMAQVRAGVRLRKALCAVLEHPSMSHRFEGTGLTILEVRMAKDFKKAHVRWTVADGDDDASDEEVVSRDVWAGHSRDGHSRASSSFSARKRSASAALRREATRLRSMASKMLRSKHTPRLVFVDDDAKSAQERALDAAFDRAAEAEAESEAHAAEARAREAEYFASVARKGSHEMSVTYPRYDAAETREQTASTDDDDRSSVRMGYAFETHDGGTPYVSDFVDPDDEAPRVAGGDDGDGLRDADDGDPAGADAEAWAAKVRAATQALRDAEEAWLEVGGDAAALDNGGFDADFDDAVDALVAEMAATGDAGADASAEAAIRAAAARARLEAEQEDEEAEEGEWFDDDDDEYVEGDEFDDDDDDDEEAEDFDFAKFDEAERRTR